MFYKVRSYVLNFFPEAIDVLDFQNFQSEFQRYFC